ncbi:MAG TPA: hypothetical protein VJA21_03395, partial [Verrucomicrobiae bacterium]
MEEVVAQICNLPYRRFSIGRAPEPLGPLQVTDLRYGRLQICATLPGAGKSTLLGEVAVRMITTPRAVAVLAVDPSSPVSGGALLGDRTRVRFPPGEPRLYFRSQASAGALGGVAPA